MRLTKRKFFYFSLLFLAASVLLLNSCLTFRKSDAQVKKHFRKQNTEVSIQRFPVPGYADAMRVVGAPAGVQQELAVVFVHGAPGSSQDFYRYMQDSLLLREANLYSIDRLGYGYSNFGKAEESVAKHAQAVAALLAQLPEQKVLIVGHSFGGPIAALSSVYSPKIVSVVMLAPAIDPEHEKILKIAYLGKWKATRWFVPKAMRVAADEKFSHVEALREVQPLWSQVKVPVLHYHGNRDVLVPYENIHFSTQVFDPSRLDTVTLEGENHFLPWTQFERLQQQLLGMAKAIKAER